MYYQLLETCTQSSRYSHPFSFFFQYDAKMAVPMFFTQSCAIFSKIVAHFFYLLLVKPFFVAKSYRWAIGISSFDMLYI